MRQREDSGASAQVAEKGRGDGAAQHWRREGRRIEIQAGRDIRHGSPDHVDARCYVWSSSIVGGRTIHVGTAGIKRSSTLNGKYPGQSPMVGKRAQQLRIHLSSKI